MLLAKLIFLCYLLDEVGARRIVSHVQSVRNAVASSRQVLGAIQQEISMGNRGDGDEDGNDITKYVVDKVLDKCKKMKQDEAQDTSKQLNASRKEKWKEQLKLSNLCEQHGEKIISSLSKQMSNPSIFTWICTQGFELAEIKIDDKACKETSQLLLDGLQDLQSSKGQEKLTKLGIYLVRAAVILTPLPGPLGWILDKATEKLLQKLTKDAEEALDNLEKLLEKLEQKMWDTSRKVVAEEFLRVGGEQVKVAEDQVKDIESIKEDDLWKDLITDSSDSSQIQMQHIIDAAKKATSFNRWAAIEQSLATTLAILRPPAFMETSQEMEPFIKVMKIHFEIEITVLSHMFKVVEKQGQSFTQMVQAKAHRAALSVLPYLFIIGGDQPLLETMKSPLLRNPLNSEKDPCPKLENSLVCVWLDLLSQSQRAKGFQRPRGECRRKRVDGKHFEQTITFDFGMYGQGEGFGVFTHFVNSTENLLNFKCGSDDQYIARWQEIHDESKYFGKDSIAGKSVKLDEGRVERHLKFTSTGSFCPTMLTYGDVSVGELVSVKFEEDPQQSPCDGSNLQQLSSRKMKSSTCYISNIFQ